MAVAHAGLKFCNTAHDGRALRLEVIDEGRIDDFRNTLDAGAAIDLAAHAFIAGPRAVHFNLCLATLRSQISDLLLGQRSALSFQQAGFGAEAFDTLFFFLNFVPQAFDALLKPFGRLAGCLILLFKLLNAVLLGHFVGQARCRFGRRAGDIHGEQVSRANTANAHLAHQCTNNPLEDFRFLLFRRHPRERVFFRRIAAQKAHNGLLR